MSDTSKKLAAIDSYKRKLAKLTPLQIAQLVDKIAHVGDGEMVVKREYARVHAGQRLRTLPRL